MNQRRLSRHKSCALYHDIVCTLLGQESLTRSLGSGQGALEAVLGLDAIDAVCGVEVLDDDDLEAGGGALSRGDGRVGQEDFPDLNMSVSVILQIQCGTYPEPALAILSLDLFSISKPIPVPSPESARVMDANSVNTSAIVRQVSLS